MRVRKSSFAILVFRWVASAALAFAFGSASGFKPAYEAHGHTMITRSVLSLGGYSFGYADLQPLTVDRFRFRYSTSIADQFAHAAAIDHIVAGVQSRDWGVVAAVVPITTFSSPSSLFGPRLCKDVTAPGYVDAPPWYFGAANPAERMGIHFAPAEGIPFSVEFCTSMDLNSDDGHFDNDNFVGSINSMRAHLQLATNYAKVWSNSADKTGKIAQTHRIAARLMLGKALHTLQDFYAHSNWIEEFGVFSSVAEFITDAVMSGQPLPANVRSLLASQSNRNSGQGAPFATNRGGDASGAACPSREAASSDAWRLNDGNYLSPETSTVLGLITTAAWWDSTWGASGDRAPASDQRSSSRCDHGISDDASGLSGYATTKEFSGLAKDLPGWPPNPSPRGLISGEGSGLDESYVDKGAFTWQVLGFPVADDAKSRAQADATRLHQGAAYAAARHTKSFLGRFASEFVIAETSSAVEADNVLSAIFGADSPVRREIFVLDRSGTMAELLPDIKQGVERVLRDGVEYVLVDFAGADTLGGQTSIEVHKGDANVVRARLSQLTARGGGGCLTPSWEAILAGVAASGIGGDLYLLTDASASDAGQAGAVTLQAQAKRIRLHQYVTGSCSPLDETYVEAARDTGGSTNLVEHSPAAITQMLDANHGMTDVFHVVHNESGSIAGTRLVTFPIEAGVSQLRLTALGALTSVSVISPSGQTVVVGPGVAIAQSLNGWAVVIDNPIPGTWQISAVGSGNYSFAVSVNGSIDFDVAERHSIHRTGRSGHEYRAPLAQSGQSGRVWMKAHVVNGRAPLTLDLLRTDGSAISSIPLSQSATDYFEAEVVLPTEAHRFRVRGFAPDGTAFARIHGQGNIAPPPAPAGAVSATLGAAGTWRAGTANAFAVNLKNLGGDDTVSFSPGTLPTGATLTCNPSSIAVPGSEQVNVLCSINLPEAPDRADFSVVVTSTTAVPATSQTVTIPLAPLKLPLSCALDIDGDNRVDPAVDGVLLTRYLLGFRGAALTAGLTIPGPRKTDTLLSAFFGNAAQFDLVGRASPAPTATVDGLIMTRLMLGYDDISLLTGINIPSGAQYTTAAGIKDYVISRCAGGL